MDVCSLWRWHAGWSCKGKARLHGAVRRLSGLCLVGSWQTATDLTDWLSECWNNRKSPVKLRDSSSGGGGGTNRHCLQYKLRGCHNGLSIHYIHLGPVWCQVVRMTKLYAASSVTKAIRELPVASQWEQLALIIRLESSHSPGRKE